MESTLHPFSLRDISPNKILACLILSWGLLLGNLNLNTRYYDKRSSEIGAVPVQISRLRLGATE